MQHIADRMNSVLPPSEYGWDSSQTFRSSTYMAMTSVAKDLETLVNLQPDILKQDSKAGHDHLFHLRLETTLMDE